METDPDRRERLYFSTFNCYLLLYFIDLPTNHKFFLVLCDNMYKMDVIDSSYTLKEFEHIRLEHTKAFFKLLQVAKEAIGSESAIPWYVKTLK